MTDPVPSKERDIADELLEAVTVLDEPFHREAVAGTLGRASGVINRLRDDLEELHDAHDSLERENDRLRAALRGIQSCSTCEACRGAATLALGGAQPKPAHEREPPHCSSCSCGMPAPEPEALRRYVHEQLGHLASDDNRPAEALIRLAAERLAQHPKPVPLTWETFWQKAREINWTPSPDDLRKILNATVINGADTSAPACVTATNGFGITGVWCAACGSMQGDSHLDGCPNARASQPPGDGQ